MQRSTFPVSLFLVAFALAPGSSAFSATKSSPLVRSSQSTSPALNAASISMDENDDNDYGMSLYYHAERCGSNPDGCSLEDAQSYLDEILHTQKECIGAGALSMNTAICDNVDVTVEIVANLRQKIEIETKRLAPYKATMHLFNVALGVCLVYSVLHSIVAVPNIPVDSSIYANDSRGVTPFLLQEWFWSVRDGYFPLLFNEWSQNSGLVVDVSAFAEKVVPFTPQEWVWSIQNGSFGTILHENLKYGGLVVDSSFETETTPMTLQELMWSIQGGYTRTAMEHYFRNGGV